MSFPRYPEYKDSGVEWLGAIPAHWSTPPLYLRYEILLGKMLDTKRQTGESALPYLRNADVQWDRVNTIDLPEMDIDMSEIERYTLRKGDLLVCEGGEVGRTAVWTEESMMCAFQKAIHRMRPLSASEHPRYLFHVMQHACAQGVFLANGNPNTIPHLTGEALRLYRFPAPPVAEQSTIASFIDRETAKIDALVAEQRRLTDLLKEKRQAVISHAVTKGLNPDAPMRPSGVEWMGDVPAHWGTIQSRRLFSVRRELMHETDQQLTASQKYGIVLQSEFVEAEGRRVVETIMGRDKLLHVEPNDFVISMRSFQGGIEWSRLRGSISFHYVMLVPTKAVHPPFFAHLLKSTSYIQALRATTDLIRDGQELRYSHFAQVDLPVVPPLEQAVIAAFLDEETSRIDKLIDEAARLVQLLLERRSGLISAAVTGQIAVRGLATAEAA